MGVSHSRGAACWLVWATVPDAAAIAPVSTAFEEVCEVVACSEAQPAGAWLVEGLCRERPSRALIEAMIELAWQGRPESVPVPRIELLPERDWVAENQASFPPSTAGRYFVHGSHYRAGVPAGRLGLLIDASTAFGTGDHATTRGCLLALDAIALQGPRRRVLDMGTGTGILAIAAAKTWRRHVLARDIDIEAVRVTARNAGRNGVAALIDVRCSDGYRERGLHRAGPFDLILANILARPLAVMAPALARALAPGGLAVLSGLLGRQEGAVLAAHRAQGLSLVARIPLDGWHTLVLSRGRSHPGLAAISSRHSPSPAASEAQ
jgi:ribosomal protein L11 methyltransferase